ncbi:MAG: site-specific integrase, partial [Halieaceae bacterium]|nr:site-specific integrase [Halieaceae bacterium]
MERGLSENTLAAYRRDLSLYDEWLGEQTAESLLTAGSSQI